MKHFTLETDDVDLTELIYGQQAEPGPLPIKAGIFAHATIERLHGQWQLDSADVDIYSIAPDYEYPAEVTRRLLDTTPRGGGKKLRDLIIDAVCERHSQDLYAIEKEAAEADRQFEVM